MKNKNWLYLSSVLAFLSLTMGVAAPAQAVIPASAQTAILDAASRPSAISQLGFNRGLGEKVGQTFVSRFSGPLSKISARLIFNAPTNVTVSIFTPDANGYPSGSALASESYASTIFSSGSPATFAFSSPATVVAGQSYIFTIEGVLDDVVMVHGSDSSYANGTMVLYQPQAGWFDYSQDLWFETYIDSQVAISNSTVTNEFGTSVTLTTSGVSDQSLVTYDVSNNAGRCVITDRILRSLDVGSCDLTATVSANGPTQAVVSAPVTFSFFHTLPTRVDGVTVTEQNGQATVNWTAATSLGSLLTGYILDIKTGDITGDASGSCAPATTITSILTSCVASGLTNGRSYQFRVAAKNGAGFGEYSEWSEEVTPHKTAPGTPMNLTATRGNASVVLTWTENTYSAGAATTGYRVSVAVGNSPNFRTVALATACPKKAGANQSCTVKNLINGVSYRFTVAALNAYGYSADTDAPAPVLPATLPTAPSKPLVAPGVGQAIIKWVPPSADGGLPVTGYLVQVATRAAGPWTSPAQPCDSTSTQGSVQLYCLADNLTVGTDYYFRVAAITGAGASPWSAASVAVRSMTATSAPRALVVTTPAVKSVKVAWTTPASNGGSPVTGYEVLISTSATRGFLRASAGTCSAAASSAVLTCTITGLTTGSSWYFKVAAINVVSTSVASSVSSRIVIR
jgi:hypothetical protein